MNYIGSKHSLIGELELELDQHQVAAEGIALDLFAGTGAVAQLLKLRGHLTLANDWQHYSYLTSVAFVELNEFPSFVDLLSDPGWFGKIVAVDVMPVMAYSIEGRVEMSPKEPASRVLTYLNQLPGSRGSFHDCYCGGGSAGRLYFSQENGLRIQAIRDTIELWHRQALISKQEKAWLVACLVESADRVANTASVYGAYLKHIKKTAHKPLTLVALRPIPSRDPRQEHHAYCEDSLQLLDRLRSERLKLVYIDPPYNHRQYSANYHVLETIARWDLDGFEPRGITGLRPANVLRSDYCIQSRVELAFRKLFERINSEYLLLSYNNEGLLPEQALLNLFSEYCTEVDFRRIRFRRYRADVDRVNRVYKADNTQEFLIFGRPHTSTRLN